MYPVKRFFENGSDSYNNVFHYSYLFFTDLKPEQEVNECKDKCVDLRQEVRSRINKKTYTDLTRMIYSKMFCCRKKGLHSFFSEKNYTFKS